MAIDVDDDTKFQDSRVSYKRVLKGGEVSIFKRHQKFIEEGGVQISAIVVSSEFFIFSP